MLVVRAGMSGICLKCDQVWGGGATVQLYKNIRRRLTYFCSGSLHTSFKRMCGGKMVKPTLTGSKCQLFLWPKTGFRKQKGHLSALSIYGMAAPQSIGIH
jgi:hypothetical protein